MKICKRFIFFLISLFLLVDCFAQQDIYVSSNASMVTFNGSNIAFFGNIINDARATGETIVTNMTGLNHNGGGTVYLVRHAAHGSGATRIYDGPVSTPHTGNYNMGGSAVRFFNLVTDNDVQSPVPSNTLVNTASGSGSLRFEQEVRVTNQHTFVNGVIWTPRNNWAHAYLHYDSDGATYTGAGSGNSAVSFPDHNLHVDGYVAKTGSTDFVFPVGDGITARYIQSKDAENGTYKAAYFKKNAQNGTAGISGPSAGTSPIKGGLTKISTMEFWDFDGTGTAKVSLLAFNPGSYTDWLTDFGTNPLNSATKIVVAAWDGAWQNLSINNPPAAYSSSGYYTSVIATNPDAGFATGNATPFSAYTWGIYTVFTAPLPLKLTGFYATNMNCQSLLNWNTSYEENVSHFEVEYSLDNVKYTTAGTVRALNRNSGGTYSFNHSISTSDEIFYRLKMIDLDATVQYSNTIKLKSNCTTMEFKVYPTVSSSVINIVGNNKTNFIRIIDLTGKIVKEIHCSSVYSHQINISSLSSGVYFLSFFSGNELKGTQKVIKF